MKSPNQIQDPDVILIGSGIMSSTLGAMLKKLDPNLRIQLYEMTEEFAQEASNGWHNAGTGHAGICELSYTPDYGPDGEVDVAKAIEIFHQFEHSKQFWGYAARSGMIENTDEFINPVPHISFVYGQEQVDFLRSRHKGMQAHHFFEEMEFTEDREVIKKWAPLLLTGRDDTPVAVTKMDRGSDVNFGALAGKLIKWLGEQEGCGYATSHRITDLTKQSDGRWKVAVKDLKTNEKFSTTAKFVFIGAGGGSLPLLQKAGIDEAKGFGGFPIGGQWLICDKPEIVEQHVAKVYGMSPGAAPTMAVPHLDTRIIDGKKSLLFGPYAAWTTKFLHIEGKMTDLPGSIKLDNIGSLIKVGLHNIPLVRYLVQQGTQSMTTRMGELLNFFPDAKESDWRLIDAGIRVQAIKKEDGDAGIVHFGTEVLTSADKSMSALLGASPGASVSTNIILEVIKKSFSDVLATEQGHANMKEMIPSYDEDLTKSDLADRQRDLSEQAFKSLNLI
ncbi:malate dehydrogenase (quinone) [Puniceicoccaceae bacterium K14]|nr:malate dehydrogenase (quinone) [Puniceicoccaceae bacterium K14]